MFFKRKKVSDYLQDEQFVHEIENLKKAHQDQINSPESVAAPVMPEISPQAPVELPVTEKVIETEENPAEIAIETAVEHSLEVAAETVSPEFVSETEKPDFFESAVGELIKEEIQEVRKISNPDLELFEAELETVAQEVVTPAVEPEIIPEIIPEIVPEVIPEIAPETATETVSEIATEPTEDALADATPDMASPLSDNQSGELAAVEITTEIETETETAMATGTETETKVSFFGKLKASLSKTKDTFTRKISWIISSKTTIDEDVLEELEEALYTSDIGVKTTELIMKNIRISVKEQRYQETVQLKKIIKEEISALVKSDDTLAKAEFTSLPHVVLVVGVNGNGKTTTIGKLAHYYKKLGKKVIVGAADTFRAAAIEQLEVWAERAGCEVVKQQMGVDPAAVAYNAYEAAISRKADVLLIDTAGRLHTKVNLMNELEKISRVLKKFNPNAPHDVLLVLDATTGQNALSQARLFTESTGITGLVLTKLDGTAKGGVAIAINQELDIPVKFIGIGEKIEDLALFNIADYVNAIFD